jgi:DNA-binding transcriptional LysR family regulator
VRSTRRVELTPAGATLFADAREILASVDEAFDRVGALARGESGSMIIGSLGPAPLRHPARAAGALQQPAPGSAGLATCAAAQKLTTLPLWDQRELAAC